MMIKFCKLCSVIAQSQKSTNEVLLPNLFTQFSQISPTNYNDLEAGLNFIHVIIP